MLMPKELRSNVATVLNEEYNARGSVYLTAYQILLRLPETMRKRLVTERGKPGKNSGSSYSAASVVETACRLLPNIEIAYLNTDNLLISSDAGNIAPGNQICGTYKVRSV